MDGESILLRRTNAGRLMADNSRIIKCGSPVSNGIIHSVDRVLVDNSKLPTVNQRRVAPGVRVFTFPRIVDMLHF